MTDSEIVAEAKRICQEWVDKQGHDRCWYYPELFTQLVALLEIEATKEPALPSRLEFEKGCKRFQDEEYRCPAQKAIIEERHRLKIHRTVRDLMFEERCFDA